MPTKTKAQVHMDDRMVSNSELLALLEEREDLKEGASAFRNKDKDAKNAIIKLGEEPPYRIGRFIPTSRENTRLRAGVLNALRVGKASAITGRIKKSDLTAGDISSGSTILAIIIAVYWSVLMIFLPERYYLPQLAHYLSF